MLENKMKRPKIFISMGTPYNDKYREFRDELEDILRSSCDADPKIIGKTEYPEGNPLNKIKEVMSDCDGVLIVAYERKFVQNGQEKRNSNLAGKIADETYTTSWNHVESAMAFAMGIPLYIICEKGLKEEGLIESKIDWFVQYIDFDKAKLRAPEVIKSLQSWVSKTRTRKKKSNSVMKILTGDVSLSEMKIKEITVTMSLVASIFTAGVLASKYIFGAIGFLVKP